MKTAIRIEQLVDDSYSSEKIQCHILRLLASTLPTELENGALVSSLCITLLSHNAGHDIFMPKGAAKEKRKYVPETVSLSSYK